MTQNSLQEVSRISININKLEDPSLTWHNSYLTLRSHKGLHIFELLRDINCYEKKFAYSESYVDTSRTSPAQKLFTDKVINKNLPNLFLQEMIIDHTMWPHNPQLLHESTCVTSFKWSPFGLVNNHESVLAVLNNVGGIDLYVKQLRWQCAVKLSDLLLNYLQQSNFTAPETFEDLRTAVHSLASTSMCWSTLIEDKSCFLITGQKNGNIIFWAVNSKCTAVSATFYSLIQEVANEIVSITWIDNGYHHFLLICCDILGKIILLNCKIYNNSVELMSKHVIWPHGDRMISNYIEYLKKDDKLIIFCNKNRHLAVTVLDDNFNVLNEYINNIADYRITCIRKHNNNIYLTIVNGKILKVDVTVDKASFEVKLKQIQCKELCPSHELFSICFSHNNVMCCLAVIDRKVQPRKESSKIDLLITTNYNTESLPKLLIENPSKTLTFYWDIIELLRFRVHKQKELPIINYDEIYTSGSGNIYSLKLYLIFLSLHNNLKATFKVKQFQEMPEENTDVIKEEILVFHAETQINRLYNKYQEDSLTDFEMECFDGARKFLEYYFEKNNRLITEIVDPAILKAVKPHVYTCQCCDEELKGFLCKNKHINMYCMLTFTLIEDDRYLICTHCNSTARLELIEQNYLCLFCDLDLKLIY